MKDVVFGIDIGGTNTKFGIIDREGNCYFESSIPTNSCNGVDEFVNNLAKELNTALSNHKNLQLQRKLYLRQYHA